MNQNDETIYDYTFELDEYTYSIIDGKIRIWKRLDDTRYDRCLCALDEVYLSIPYPRCVLNHHDSDNNPFCIVCLKCVDFKEKEITKNV